MRSFKLIMLTACVVLQIHAAKPKYNKPSFISPKVFEPFKKAGPVLKKAGMVYLGLGAIFGLEVCAHMAREKHDEAIKAAQDELESMPSKFTERVVTRSQIRPYVEPRREWSRAAIAGHDCHLSLRLANYMRDLDLLKYTKVRTISPLTEQYPNHKDRLQNANNEIDSAVADLRRDLKEIHKLTVADKEIIQDPSGDEIVGDIDKANKEIESIEKHITSRAVDHPNHTCVYGVAASSNDWLIISPKLCPNIEASIARLKTTATSLPRKREDFKRKVALQKEENDYQAKIAAEKTRVAQDTQDAEENYAREKAQATADCQAQQNKAQTAKEAAERNLASLTKKKASFKKNMTLLRVGVYGSALIAAGIYGFMKLKKASTAK